MPRLGYDVSTAFSVLVDLVKSIGLLLAAPTVTGFIIYIVPTVKQRASVAAPLLIFLLFFILFISMPPILRYF